MNREVKEQGRLEADPNIRPLQYIARDPPNSYLVYSKPTLLLSEALQLDVDNPAGELLDWRSRVSALAGVARGLEALHSSGCFHMAVHPESVELHFGEARLLDCGWAVRGKKVRIVH